ncbi:MAG: hypothetical protein ABI742_02480, partial [Gemmatimonadota bacterium]
MRRFMQGTGVALVIAAVSAACGSGSDSTGSNPSETIGRDPTKSGEAQTAAVATAPTDSLRVIVKQDGAPLAGATVTWATNATGAVSPTTSQTDAAGLAATSWTLGHTAGAQTATATLASASGSPVTFHATATPGAASSLAKLAGDGQTGIIAGAFASQVQVALTDQFGNPIAGTQVHFAGTGGVTPSAADVATDLNGKAATAVTGAATPGAGSVIATVAGVGTPATFTLTTANAVREVSIGSGVLFKSARNNSTNPAVDTVAVGQGVLWRWKGGTHSVESTGAPAFTSSAISSAVGNTYILT